MFDFSGKTVLVTGGAQGIGKETVKGVVEGGGHAVILDINEEVGKATAAEVGNCSFYKIDLGSSENIRAVMAQVLADFDRVDVLINVGGVISKAPFEEISDAEWERTLRINLTGTFTTCSAIYPYFKEKKGGRIVNVSSVAGKIGGGLLGTAAYASSKAGVIGLTKAVARELASRGITVNAIAPGFIETEMTEAMPEAARETVKKQIPLQRTGQVSDVAGVAAFLASDLADYITGQVISVDGGMHM